MRRYRYAINILKQPEPRVSEQDIELALRKQDIDLHPDTYLDEVDEGVFNLDIPVGVKVGQLKRDLEALDGHSQCQVDIETVR